MQIMRLFEPRLKLWAHLIQFLLITAAFALVGVHMNLGVRYGRAEIMVLSVGAKSILGIAYQLLSQHVSPFRKWESPTANLILNASEVPLWLVVAILKIKGATISCEGTACSLSTGVIVICFILLLSFVHASIVSGLDFQYYKRTGTMRGSSQPVSNADYESHQFK